MIRLIYHKIGMEGMSTRALANYLEGRYPPSGKYRHWEGKQIALFVRSSLYKGEYYCNRQQQVKVPAKQQRAGEPMRMVKVMIDRPRDEWILVQVPPLVTPDLWELANQMLNQNAKMGRRNAREPFLLTGLVKCAECGYSYVGRQKNYHRKSDNRVTVTRYYACSSISNRMPAVVAEIGCTKKQVLCHLLDDAVWKCLCDVLLTPELLLNELDAMLEDDKNDSINRQLVFIQRQIEEKDEEDDKLYRAYVAGVFDEHEFAARRRLLKQAQVKLSMEQSELDKQRVTKEQIEEDKAFILEFANYLRTTGMQWDAPFELKQRIIKIVVERIIVNTVEQYFQIEGKISGRFAIHDAIVSSHTGKGSLSTIQPARKRHDRRSGLNGRVAFCAAGAKFPDG